MALTGWCNGWWRQVFLRTARSYSCSSMGLSLAGLALVTSACAAQGGPAPSAASTAVDAASANILDTANAEVTADVPTAAPCNTCTKNADCGKLICVRSTPTAPKGFCRAACSGSAGCATGHACVQVSAGKDVCLPIAGQLSGSLSCPGNLAGGIVKCTGSASGTFAGMLAKLNQGILQPTVFQDQPVTALQVSLNLAPLGDVVLVVILPKVLAVGALPVGAGAPASLNLAPSGPDLAPRLGAGSAGSVTIKQVWAAATTPTELGFDVTLGLYATPGLLCTAGSATCSEGAVATCDACGNGYTAGQLCAPQGCSGGVCK